MSSPFWQLSVPLDAIIFDCDGTLSAIEGIDELARYNNVNKHVEALTKFAMERGAMNEELYRERLQLVQPSRQQIDELVESYIAHAIKNASSMDFFAQVPELIYAAFFLFPIKFIGTMAN